MWGGACRLARGGGGFEKDGERHSETKRRNGAAAQRREHGKHHGHFGRLWNDSASPSALCYPFSDDARDRPAAA